MCVKKLNETEVEVKKKDSGSPALNLSEQTSLLLLPPSLSLSLLVRPQHRVVSQDLAELVEAVLHLGDAGQLRLQPLLLLGEREARGRVQLLEAPAALAVELQQVRVVLPGKVREVKGVIE